MHELSIAEHLLRMVVEEAGKAGATRVRSLCLEVGSLSGIVSDSLRFCFEIAARGTVAEGASLEIVMKPGVSTCRECGLVAPVLEAAEPCPGCGGYCVELSGSSELILKQMEI